MKIRYIINKIYPKNTKINVYGNTNMLKADLTEGIYYMLSDSESILFECIARSGGWGNGPLPTGDYIVNSITPPSDISKLENKDAYSLWEYGFFALLNPTFKTDRTALGIHPDGGLYKNKKGEFGYIGTLGCIGLDLKSFDEAVRCFNLFRDGLEQTKKITVTVMQQLVDPRFKGA